MEGSRRRNLLALLFTPSAAMAFRFHLAGTLSPRFVADFGIGWPISG